MNTLRISRLSAIAVTAVLLATSPSHALPAGAATSTLLAGIGSDAIVRIAQNSAGPAMRGGGPSARGGGPAFRGGQAFRGGGSAFRGGGRAFRGGQRFSGQRFSGQRFNGQRFNGRRFGARQFRGNQFGWRGHNFRSRRYAAAPFFYGDPGYGYCERVLVPRLTPRGIVMRWVRRCPDSYPYGYDSYWW